MPLMIEIDDAKPDADASCDTGSLWVPRDGARKTGTKFDCGPPPGSSRAVRFRVAAGGEIAAHASNAAERIRES
jgi:hypothetical protein